MIKGAKDILILFLVLFALGVGVVLMPWSELNFTSNFPDWLTYLTQHFGIEKAINGFYGELSSNSHLMQIVRTTPAQYNLGDYAYSLFLFSAITASAVAFVLVGREENTEKTVLEVKK